MLAEAITVAAGHKCNRNQFRPTPREAPQQSEAEMKAELDQMAAFFKASKARKNVR